MDFNADWEQIVAAKDARIAELEALVRFYEEQVRLSAIRKYAPSSEKDSLSNQLGIFSEAELAAFRAEPEPELEEITYTRRKRAGKREDDLSGLLVETIEHTLPDEDLVCPECGGELHVMGHDIRRELVIVPAQVKVVEHRQAVYSCRGCEKNNDHVPFVKAPVPVPVIKGSFASPSAVAHIMAQKYVMHSPLYRQEKNWGRQGVALSRQTMANWVIRCAMDWLLPIYNRLMAIMLLCWALHADETRLQVLRELGRAAKAKSFMWLYRTSGDTDRHIILFEYQPSRSHVHPENFLKGFKGLLHTDGFSGYHILPPEIIVVGCWSHYVCRIYISAEMPQPLPLRQSA
jgi:transposase